MKFRELVLKNGSGAYCSLSNITGYWPTASSVIDVTDAIEDATDAEDACRRLGKVDLLYKTWTVNRVTEDYTRLLHVDGFGNPQYLYIEK